MRNVKGVMRSLGSRLGLRADRSQPASGECGADWYDRAYRDVKEYHCPYAQSRYYFLWTVIVDRIRRDRLRRVLEIGCGPGQLALFLLDQGVEQYVGLDFSPQAIEIARENAPRGRFVLGDARVPAIYDEVEYDVIICTEVLEHVQDDLLVLSRFGPGKRCLCSVPNFPYESHVRHFEDAKAVADRYGPFFHEFDVMTFLGSGSNGEQYFLLDGIRNDSIQR
jgi:SAM-dependent methyltransferase